MKPCPRITPAMILGGIGGYFLGRYAYDAIARRAGTMTSDESDLAGGEAVVAGVIGAGIVAGVTNILAIAAGSPLAGKKLT